MDTFGDRLTSVREDHGLSIQAVAETLRVDYDLLRALERNDFDALPDEAVMMDCLHAYAECLEVDAELMIEDYLQERDKHLRRREHVVAEQAAETPAPAIPTEAERRPRFSVRLAALGVAAIAMLAAWWMLSRDETAPTPEAPATTAPVQPQPLAPKTPADVAPTPVEPQRVSPEKPAEVEPTPPEPQPLASKTPADVAPTPVEAQGASSEKPADVAPTSAEPQRVSSATPTDVVPTPVEPPAARPADPTPAPSSLRITDYGVGTAVENRELVGQSDRFTDATRVWFWTRVQGGARGDRIDHVWLREGVEVARISLDIGSASWRTYSTQTLHAGAAGDWSVEARDDAGRVLARSDFVCVP